ncbi:nucleotidyltransferase domain-containing protein [Candidatus Woesearchaeota archaeon]|nr:nucleotidyltransferase domain-containing protein [Candidatus Woesearchaeota archaeon]
MFKELYTLKQFFEEPEREFHLREFARLSKINPMTASKHLGQWVKNGILGVRNERGLKIYHSKSENLMYKEYKKIYTWLKIMGSGLVEFLREELNQPTIILFGSCARGEDNGNSDMDIFVLTETKKEVQAKPFEKKVNRPIQLHIMSHQELGKSKKTNHDLVNSLINGKVLHGYFEVLPC